MSNWQSLLLSSILTLVLAGLGVLMGVRKIFGVSCLALAVLLGIYVLAVELPKKPWNADEPESKPAPRVALTPPQSPSPSSTQNVRQTGQGNINVQGSQNSINVAPTPQSTPPDPPAKLYYDDREQGKRELDGAAITLGPISDRRLCSIPHVWATKPPAPPDAFAVCGIWMMKPRDASSRLVFGAAATLYVDLSEEVTDENQACRRSTEKPEPPYRVSLICPGWPSVELNRWILPAFFGAPIPRKDTKVRVRFEYPKNGRAEATFILHAPKSGTGAMNPRGNEAPST